jgi:hypothetical protein
MSNSERYYCLAAAGKHSDVVPQSTLQDQGSWIQNLYEMVELGTGAGSATLKRDLLANMASMLKACDRKSNLASELRVSELQLELLIKLLEKVGDVQFEKSHSTSVVPITNNHRNDGLTGEFLGFNFVHSESIQKVKPATFNAYYSLQKHLHLLLVYIHS